METETVTAIRTVWTGLLELSRQTDMGTGERIMSVGTVAADYETKPFLTLRLKLIEAVQSCYQAEDLKRLDTGKEKVDEETADVELDIAEATYLDMIIRVTEFKGALTLKRNLWRVIATLYDRHRKEKEAL